MKRYFILGAWLLGCGCNLLKNVHTEKQTEHNLLDSTAHLEMQTDKKLQVKEDYIMSRQNDADATYAFEIWPKGKFTFSAAAGFSGEADSLHVKGTKKNIEQLKMQSEASSVFSDNIRLKETNTKKKVQEKQLTEKISSASWKLIIAAIVVVAMVGYWVYRKIRA